MTDIEKKQDSLKQSFYLTKEPKEKNFLTNHKLSEYEVKSNMTQDLKKPSNFPLRIQFTRTFEGVQSVCSSFTLFSSEFFALKRKTSALPYFLKVLCQKMTNPFQGEKITTL